jgi:diguanylate cyclase (GGDEF)-like protein
MDMHPSGTNDFPRFTIDFPLEFSPKEIAGLAPGINTLLKCNYLIGSSLDFDGAFQSLFDIALEIAGVDCCAYISGFAETDNFEVAASRHVPHDSWSEPSLFLPVAVARSFNKGIHLEAEKDPQFASVCQGWKSTSLVVFPLRRNTEFIGALLFGKKDRLSFTPVQIKLLWILSGQAENLILQRDSVRTLSFYSFLDPLTHLHNRRYIDALLEKEVSRSRRTGKPVSLLMLDLDGFKAYNDTFLHSAGDIALQEIAAIFKDCVREVDTVARLGGDEFAILLVESTSHGARDLASRLGERMDRHLVPGRENIRTERLTVSIGIASFPSDAFDKQDLVHKADHALHMAKNQGSGKVCLYNEISDLVSTHETTMEIPVQKIYDATRSVVDMDMFLEILLFTAMQGLSARRGSIVVANPDGNFTFRAAIGFGNGEVCFSPGATVPPGAVTSWVTETKEPLLVSGPKDAPLPIPMKRKGYKSTSFLSIPLLEDGKMLGVLHLTNKAGDRPFTRDDLEAFAPFSREFTSILSRGLSFLENVKMFSTSILRSLSNALELRYPFMSGHSRRVQDLCLSIGRRLGLGNEELGTLETAAILHDIGIVGIPGEILAKRRKLTERELEIARKHPFLGAKLLEGVPGMEKARRAILEHQEFFDGSGYPHGLRGEEISPEARILSLVEFYDSITSSRPYRGGLHHEEALQLVKNNRNTLFDERICRAFLEEMEAASPDGRLEQAK